jgi:hypothetical protein
MSLNPHGEGRREVAIPGEGPGRETGRRPARQAFTLLELLVAATITAAIGGFIVILVANVAGVWTRTSNRLTADAQARYLLEQLALDLSAAQFRDDGNVWLAASVLDATGNSGFWQPAAANGKPGGGLSLAMAAPNLADARFGVAGVWLRLFTTRRGANDATNATTAVATLSAPVAVGYQIVRHFSAASPLNLATSYQLHRAEVRPAATGSPARPGVIETGYDLSSGAYNPGEATADGTAGAGDPATLKIPGAAHDQGSVIGSNVIDFGVRCYVRDATQASGLRLVFPASNATGAPANSAAASLAGRLPPNTPATAANFNQMFPDVVDVMVRILTEDGARLIALYEQAGTPLTPPAGVNAQQYWWQLAMSHSQVFTRRIVIHASSL